MKKKTKALVLFSGGLDSCLAYKTLERQGIDVEALIFTSYFFDTKKAQESAQKNGFKFRIENISKEHFELVRKPKFGYGGAMNPCIDCHLLMIQKAGEILKKEKYDFLATGEVLGQRPMSQNKDALNKIEKNSGLVSRILRPLSALKLEETEIEKNGLVRREELLGISGRSRKEQIKLAKDWGINFYPAPGGGCVLTEKEYGEKLKNLLQNKEEVDDDDLALLQVGRHFWKDKSWFIVGRNKEDDEKIQKLAKSNDVLAELKDIPGPLVLLRGGCDASSVDEAKDLVVEYLSETKKNKIGEGKFKIEKI